MGAIRPQEWDPETETFVEGDPQLFFDTLSRNVGDVGLDLLVEDADATLTSAVSQCVAWSYDAVCRERRPAGNIYFHAEHTHFHFEEFADYEFRRLDGDGSVDYSEAGLVASSEKVSFCLMDVEQSEDHGRPVPTYVGCQPARQGISPGWADVYTSDLPGQSMTVPVPDGRYALVVTMDPVNRLAETNDADNRVEAIVELSQDGKWVEVVERRFSS